MVDEVDERVIMRLIGFVIVVDDWQVFDDVDDDYEEQIVYDVMPQIVELDDDDEHCEQMEVLDEIE